MACLCADGDNDLISNDTKTCYSDWMSKLSPTAHTVPLNQIAIPGSHDSFTWYLDKKGPISKDLDKTIRDMGKMFGPLVKDFIYNWSITQKYNVTQQLDAGIRYFDIRISRKDGSSDIFIVHGLFGMKIDSILAEIKAFLDEHPKEIVLLDFNHFYDMTLQDHSHMTGKIQEIFADKMCPLLDMESVTLDMLWQNNLQVLVFYHNEAVTDNYCFWPGSSIPSPWPDVSDTSKLLRILEKNYEKGRPSDTFYVTQGILTPDSSYIFSHLGENLQKMAEKVAGPLTSWLRGKAPDTNTEKGINVCIMDLVQMANYVPSVIDLNKCL